MQSRFDEQGTLSPQVEQALSAARRKGNTRRTGGTRRMAPATNVLVRSEGGFRRRAMNRTIVRNGVVRGDIGVQGLNRVEREHATRPRRAMSTEDEELGLVVAPSSTIAALARADGGAFVQRRPAGCGVALPGQT